jgi:hypothetical protein
MIYIKITIIILAYNQIHLNDIHLDFYNNSTVNFYILFDDTYYKSVDVNT